MLSPGRYHLEIPKDLDANLEFRERVLVAATKSAHVRACLVKMCSEDILFFINLFIIQINPDIPEKGPFITWPYQDVAILGGETEIGGRTVFQDGILASVVDRKDIRWPKSRDGGASWIVLMVILWLCLFKDNIQAGAISREEDAVDEIGNPSSLFEKVRVMLRHLPEWLKGGKVKDKKGSFIFPRGNTFVGSANVGSAFVGGRLTILLVDEFGQFDKNGEWIYDFTRDVCKCRVFVYTHKAQVGMAYALSYDVKFAEMREIMTHWSQHPRKNQGLYRYDVENARMQYLDAQFMRTTGYAPTFRPVLDGSPFGGPCPGIRSPWYDEECKARNARDVSMNLDIDPRGASDQFFDAHRLNYLRVEHCMPPRWVGDLVFDKETGHPIELVENPDGLLKLWVSPKSLRGLPNMRAGAGVDISAGVGASPSCLSVFDAGTGRKVLEYANANIFQHEFAAFTAAALRMIRDDNGINPMLIWEIQYAMVFDATIRKLMYRPFWIRRDEDALGRPRDNKGRAGQSTQRQAFYTLMTEYRHGLYEQLCINHSEPSLDECLNFVYTESGEGVVYRPKGKAKMTGSGAKIHHGDVVVADALGYKIIKELGFEGVAKTEAAKSPRPGSWEFREWLHERRDSEREEEAWA